MKVRERSEEGGSAESSKWVRALATRVVPNAWCQLFEGARRGSCKLHNVRCLRRGDDADFGERQDRSEPSLDAVQVVKRLMRAEPGAVRQECRRSAGAFVKW